MANNGKFWVDGQKISGVAEPEVGTDAATRDFVETAIASAVAPLATTNYVDSAVVGALNALTSKADTSYVDSQDGALATLISGKSDQSVVDGVITVLSGKSDTGHTHTQGEVTGLVTALSNKSDVGHTHTQANITNLVSDLAGKAALAHTHSGIPVMFRLNADVAQNSGTTFSNLFTQAVLAGEVWSFEAILYVTTAASTTGIVTQVDSPSSPTASQISMLTLEGPTVIRNLSAAANATLTGTAGLTTVLETRVSGTIEVGANAGNIVVKFRSEVNGSAVTVKRGSWAKFFKH